MLSSAKLLNGLPVMKMGVVLHTASGRGFPAWRGESRPVYQHRPTRPAVPEPYPAFQPTRRPLPCRRYRVGAGAASTRKLYLLFGSFTLAMSIPVIPVDPDSLVNFPSRFYCNCGISGPLIPGRADCVKEAVREQATTMVVFRATQRDHSHLFV